MILLYDKDNNVVMLNPEYIVGAHQEGKMTVVNCVGDMVYKVQGSPEDVHDAWTGVGETEIDLEGRNCTTCLHHENNDDQLPCSACDAGFSEWEPEYDVDTTDAGEDAPDTGGTQVRVSGVPYAVKLADIQGCPSSRGDADA